MADGKVVVDAVIEDDEFKRQIKDLEKHAKESGESIEGEHKKHFNILGKMAGGTAKLVKGVAVATVSAGSAIAGLASLATNSYAEYEQLIGGVETLFGESAGLVEQYADNAYKTAGLSANQYMEQVTGFSASLLQSLGGDTKKAAEYGNMAIIDMSDNANKMGTSMESIQNAYQGFAKQNYTMLDNLKLGYGGTKSEMERLIADANMVKEANGEMADLSIESFADVTEAIHIMQTEMGITGTTALEAEGTISGSVGSMRAAWQNLVTGIADDNANFEVLIDNFVQSAAGAFENMLPRFEQALIGIGELIDALMPIIVEKIPTIITEFLPKIIESGVNIIKSLAQGLQDSTPQLVQNSLLAIKTLVRGIIESLPMIMQAGLDIMITLCQELTNDIPNLVPVVKNIITGMVTFFANNFPDIIKTGIELLGALIKGIIECIPTLISNIPQVLNAITDGLREGISAIWNIGSDLVVGLWNGISDKVGWIVDKVKGFGESIMSGLKSFFGIASPSKVMENEIGQWLAKGIGVGFEKNNPIIDIQKSLQIGLKGMERSLFGNTTTNTTTNNYMTNKFVGVSSPDQITRSLRLQQLYGGLA